MFHIPLDPVGLSNLLDACPKTLTFLEFCAPAAWADETSTHTLAMHHLIHRFDALCGVTCVVDDPDTPGLDWLFPPMGSSMEDMRRVRNRLVDDDHTLQVRVTTSSPAYAESRRPRTRDGSTACCRGAPGVLRTDYRSTSVSTPPRRLDHVARAEVWL